ncbi:hypothetical protein K458DRAFT_310555 [Lentithecium fluviatile CBS 122367]|uniref:Uncharacterized protein n=1 Tax=Lentithecium fluviatile CBS 122367 TaxID=1168545 RepID=A0A6G1ISJ8_9PLEO|nr:hypothetical protein K458DRAFT_310555 [Lentithecium fluviatile CBS 122367]
MHTLTLLISTLGLTAAIPTSSFSSRQAAAAASVDRYAGPGCSGTVCNKAGSGDLHEGCNVISDACTTSLHLNYANTGCQVAIWTDAACSNVYFYANVTSYECYQLGPPIQSISVTC